MRMNGGTDLERTNVMLIPVSLHSLSFRVGLLKRNTKNQNTSHT